METIVTTCGTAREWLRFTRLVVIAALMTAMATIVRAVIETRRLLRPRAGPYPRHTRHGPSEPTQGGES